MGYGPANIRPGSFWPFGAKPLPFDPHCPTDSPQAPPRLRPAVCVDLGVDIRIIAEALGHESLESTKIYTQVSSQRTRRIAELFCPPET